MADIVTMPGVFRPEAEQPTDPARCLTSALNAGLTDVAIIGRSISGEIHVYGSQASADAVIGLMQRGIAFLADAPQGSGVD